MRIVRLLALALLLPRIVVDPGSASAQEMPGSRPDVVLITIDTLRADALGFAGNTLVETPVLDRLAGQGRVFTRAHAHNVVTLPSHANILTGLYPYQHGVRDNSGFRLEESIPTLATVLRAAGYATGAFVAAYPLDAQFGLDRGFEVYDDRIPSGPDPTEFVLPERRGGEVVTAALEWWRGEAGGPRFLWLHLFDPHAPYDPPEPFASKFRGRPYLGEVAATDSYLRPLLEPHLEGAEPPAVIAVTSDHGEALGEHGEMTHGLFAYEPTLAVPLVLWGAGVTRGRDAGPARHIDLYPTLLAAAGIESQGGDWDRQGRSLLSGSGDASSTTYFEALSANLNRGWAPLRGVIRDERKLIALPLPELYDLAEDPREARNRISDRRSEARSLIGELPAESVWPPERGAISPEQAERLRSLGYLAGSAEARESYGPEDDPKSLVEVDRMLHKVIESYSRGEAAEAAGLARRLVERRPDMAIGRSLLAQTLLETGATAEALQIMRRAREENVATETLLRQLGLTLSQNGDSEEALEVLTPLATGGDPRSLNALALALSEAGRHDEAEKILARVLELDPDNSKALEQLSLVELRQGQWTAARDRARSALAVDPQLPLAWNNLGVALYRLANAQGAIDAWRRAVDLDPELWDALYNLGTKASENGRAEVARAALEKFVEGAPRERYAADLRRARVLLSRLRRAEG